VKWRELHYWWGSPQGALVYFGIGYTIVALVVLWLGGAASGQMLERAAALPRLPPTEFEKVEALKLGYILNGFSMVRDPAEGSIDVSATSTVPKAVKVIPVKPEPEVAEVPPERKVKAEPGVHVVDVCTRHGLRKVISGASWKCRK
jgi:hypothetical protein